MKPLAALILATALTLTSGTARAQGLIDKGFVHGWNLMVDPSFGNGCLIQRYDTDDAVVRLGFDATQRRGYFVVFNPAWGDLKTGQTFDITFDLDGEIFKGVATGFHLNKVPGAGVFFQDRDFVYALAKKKVMTLYDTAGATVMTIDLAGSDKAIEYARACQKDQG